MTEQASLQNKLSRRTLRVMLALVLGVQIGVLGTHFIARQFDDASAVPDNRELNVIEDKTDNIYHIETASLSGKGLVRTSIGNSAKARALRPKEDKAQKAAKEEKKEKQTKAPKAASSDDMAPTTSSYPSSSPTDSPTVAA